MTALIEDHALVGDLHTAALIHRSGIVTWQSFPDFDSPAVFASLIGTPEHGSWEVRATDPDAHVRRRYLPGTLVLETTWTVPGGQARVLDFTPTRAPGCGNPQLIRIVQGVRGVVQMSSRLLVRFAYGKVAPRLVRHPHQFGGDRYAALAGPDALYLDSSIALSERANGTVAAAFSIRPGERQVLALSWQPSHLPAPPRPGPAAALESTIAFWSDWSARSTYTGPYQQEVHRSLITLEALTYAPTGGMVAAPTTSLPEEIGGERNWDYRYTWLRDAAIALSVLVLTGHLEEAAAWRDWLARGARRAHCPIARQERAPARTAQAAVRRTATSECRRPRRSRGSDRAVNRLVNTDSSRVAGLGDLIRQTVADWRHIEAPVMQGDFGRSPRQPEPPCVRDGLASPVTLRGPARRPPPGL